MSATIYLEGGGDSKDLRARCREGFRKLLENSSFTGRLPKLVACGGRASTFDDFKTAHKKKREGDFVAMLIDSEDPMEDTEAAWAHLKKRDGWAKPKNSDDEQVLMMTTCMETWIVADRAALRDHYGRKLQESALPSLTDLEKQSRQTVQDKLAKATRSCSNAYTKGKRSFEILGKLEPDTLESRLPSFARGRRILKNKL